MDQNHSFAAGSPAADARRGGPAGSLWPSRSADKPSEAEKGSDNFPLTGPPVKLYWWPGEGVTMAAKRKVHAAAFKA